MSTSATIAATQEKPTSPETDEQSEEEDSQESDGEQGMEEATKEQEKDVGQAASGANSQHPSVTYGQQAEEARRAYAQYAAHFGPTSAHMAPHPAMAGPWGYPPPGSAYYHPAYIPVGPNGAPMIPSYYLAPPPPGSGPFPGHPFLTGPDGRVPLPPLPHPGVDGEARTRKIVTDKIFIACAYCRHRKLRCTGEQPKCGVCVRYEQNCSYDQRRRTRGPGKKSLMALGIDVTVKKTSKKPDPKADAPATDGSDDQTAASNSVAQAAPPMPAPLLSFPALSGSPSAAPRGPPMPPPGTFPPGPPLESSALTAAAIMNALPGLQAYGQPNGQPYHLMYPPMQAPPMPPPPSPPVPKTPSPRAGKKKAADSPASPPKKRQRTRKSQA